MNKKPVFGMIAVGLILLLLISVLTAAGQEGSGKPQAEGTAGNGGQFVPEAAAVRPWAEGEAGLAAPDESPQISLNLVYIFSGVTDDGAKGAATRKEATSILCTNTAATTTLIEVRLYQWDGSQVGIGSIGAIPNATYTFSTQNTTIYFDDVLLDPSGGTAAIFQGSGQVWADQAGVICTAEVLDPLNYPPTFVSALELFRR